MASDDVPRVPRNTDSPLRNVLDRISDAVNRLQRFQDGVLSGEIMASAGDGSGAAGPQGDPGIQGPPGEPGGDYTPDLTPPPTPTGLAAAAGLANIIITWDAPTYTQGHGNGQTNIYAVKRATPDILPPPTFGDAQPVGSGSGPITIAALPSDLGTKWYIWIKFLTVDGVESAAPAGGVNGVVAQTGLIGGLDLAPLLIEARHLAAATPSILADQTFETFGSPRVQWLPRTDPAVPANCSFPNAAQFRNRDGVVACPVFIPAFPGEQYRVSVLVNRDGLDVSAGIEVYALDTSGAALTVGIGTAPSNAAASSVWEMATVDLQMPAGTASFKVGPFINQSGGGAKTAWFTGLLVQKKIDATLVTTNMIVAGSGAIGALAVDNAAIGNLAVDDGKIANLSAAKLTIGDGTIGGVLKSTNYVSNFSGWIVRPNGTAEFDFASIRGTLLASQVAANFINAGMIDSRGLTIKDAGGTVIFGSGTGLDWSLVNGVLKPADGATSDLTFVGQGASPYIQGNTIGKASGAAAWDTGVYSKESFTGGVVLSFVVPDVSYDRMLGLSTNPSVDAGFNSINYAIYTTPAGQFLSYESGTGTVLGTYVAGDQFVIAYDGSFMRYYKNGVVMRSFAVSAGIKFYLDSSFYQAGGKLKSVALGAYGAPSSIQPSNPITAGNISTYIGSAAIGTAYIATAAITNALIGDTIQSPGFVPGVTGWRIQKSTGTIEAQNLIARGDIQASSITAAALTVAGNSIFSPVYASAIAQYSSPSNNVWVPIGSPGLATVSIDPGATGVVVVNIHVDWVGPEYLTVNSGGGGGGDP